MKIYRPTIYKKTVRITMSKKHNDVVCKSAITVVETTKQEVVDTIKKVYEKELIIGDNKPNDFVKLTVQILFESSSKRKKDEFSFRLYRCGLEALQRLIDYIDSL